MASVVDICNVALGKLGAERISSIDNPQSDNEQLCQLFYPIVLNLMLERRDWTFLQKRTVLSTPVATAPEWGYSFAFLVPNLTYRIIDVRQSDTGNNAVNTFQWHLEDNKIVCDRERIYVRYLSSDINSAKLSGVFVMAFATRLAAEMAVQITENRTLKNDLYQESEALIDEAAAVDGLQGKHEQIQASSLQNARRGGGVAGGGF